MKASDFLKRRNIGFTNGKPTLSRRDWRAFILFMVAGGRTVVMNADIRGFQLDLSKSKNGAIVGNNSI